MSDTAARAAELGMWQAELAEVDRSVERHEAFKAQTFVFGTGGVIVLIGLAFEPSVASNSLARPLVLLLIAFVCAFLGMFLVDRDEAILALLNYRETVIKPRVRELLGRDDVLGGYEFFNREAYGRNRPLLRKFAHRLTAPFPHALFYVAGLGSFAYLLYLRLTSGVIDGPGWVVALVAAALAQVYSWTAAFLTGGQWAQLGSPPTERGIPFLRRRARAQLPQPDGWSPGDPHAHTNWSDGWRSVWTQAESATRRSLEWMVLTDHSDGVGEDWCDYIEVLREVERRLDSVTLLPGAEVTVVDRPEGDAQGDMLVYGWPAAGAPPPANRVSRAAHALELVSRAGAFAIAAHPYRGGAKFSGGIPGLPFGAPAWTDWDTPGLTALELLSFERTASDVVIDRWFSLLEASLGAAGVVWATGGTDSHMPWHPPGSRGMTWVRADGAGRPRPADVIAALQSGRSVVSGRGDFGTIEIDGAGPGERAVCAGHGPLSVTFEARPARKRRCVSVELLGPRVTGEDGSIKPRHLMPLAPGPFETTFTLPCAEAAGAGFVVAHFSFGGGKHGTREVADVWTNPIFLGE